jgi:hypothetical protein
MVFGEYASPLYSPRGYLSWGNLSRSHSFSKMRCFVSLRGRREAHQTIKYRWGNRCIDAELDTKYRVISNERLKVS